MPRLAITRGLRLRQRLDTLAYLLLVLLVVLVSTTALVSALSAVGLVQARDSFAAWLGDGVPYRLLVFSLSWLPVVLLLNTYQRFSQAKLAAWECPGYCVFFGLYVYLWAVATLRAWCRLALRRGSWTKTPRQDATALAWSGPYGGGT